MCHYHNTFPFPYTPFQRVCKFYEDILSNVILYSIRTLKQAMMCVDIVLIMIEYEFPLSSF